MVLDEFRRDTPFHCRIYCLLFADFLLIVWVRLVICNLRPGKQRLLAAAPVLATTCMLPLFFAHDTEVVTTVAVAFVHVWVRTIVQTLSLALKISMRQENVASHACTTSMPNPCCTLMHRSYQAFYCVGSQLTNFKVLGLALDRGPLTLPLSALQFATVLLAPITPQIGETLPQIPTLYFLSHLRR